MRKQHNLILIGMPGSGKSQLGKRLSRQLGMRLLDTDTMIEAKAGQRISEIFATQGEAAFRDLETRCVHEAAQCQGVVIATGGGVILREDNMRALAASGLIVFVDRHPSHILRSSLADRPLVNNQADRLWTLYYERLHLYRSYAHRSVPNRRHLWRTVRHIASLYRNHAPSPCHPDI